MAKKTAEAELTPPPPPLNSTITPANSSDSVEDPSVHAAEDDGKEESTKEDSDEETVVRESKRRKNCPTALNQLSKEELLNTSDLSFCFSFDSKSASTPEVTPKFGSFNIGRKLDLVSPPSVDNPYCQIPSETGEEEEDEDEAVGAVKSEEFSSFEGS
ncbi:hypothetical protein Nepgr_022070 [Nepenthes gracilis]|uniref:Uncharacterized protein n=1 Tax=Nepenthes gracilis TaxID=150966 RepID=A0AAD3T029_NEPGR|nr:hypothetical protein Nepgr_022070 [Nepenthes gracilis]